MSLILILLFFLTRNIFLIILNRYKKLSYFETTRINFFYKKSIKIVSKYCQFTKIYSFSSFVDFSKLIKNNSVFIFPFLCFLLHIVSYLQILRPKVDWFNYFVKLLKSDMSFLLWELSWYWLLLFYTILVNFVFSVFHFLHCITNEYSKKIPYFLVF